MHTLASLLCEYLSELLPTHLVEFDYQDKTGMHHGRSYVRACLVSQHRIEEQLHHCGYTNIQIKD